MIDNLDGGMSDYESPPTIDLDYDLRGRRRVSKGDHRGKFSRNQLSIISAKEQCLGTVFIDLLVVTVQEMI